MRVEDLTINQYQLLGGGYGDLADVVLERVRQRDGSSLWAVRDVGCCLNKDGEWEHESKPSSRDDAFLARCRFASPDQALATWRSAERKTRFVRYHAGDLKELERKLEEEGPGDDITWKKILDLSRKEPALWNVLGVKRHFGWGRAKALIMMVLVQNRIIQTLKRKVESVPDNLFDPEEE